MQPKTMTETRKWIYIEKSVFLNIGLWTGERNKLKSICLIGKMIIQVIHIFYKTVTIENKDDLQIVMFPNLHISFDELFDLE